MYIECCMHATVNLVQALIHTFHSQEREVTHLQYIDWPDYGIPENSQPFLGKCIKKTNISISIFCDKAHVTRPMKTTLHAINEIYSP